MPRYLPALVVLGCLAGCNNTPPPPPPFSPPEVLVSRAIVGPVTDFEEFQGKTEAEKSVEVRAHVSGYLDRLNFKDGAEVKEKDVLFEIDPRPFQAELERSDAMLALADSHVKRLEYDFSRAQTLLAKGSISREDYDKTAGDLDEARNMVRAARAARNASKLNCDYSRVTAPISGRISRRFVDPGNMIKADDTVLTRIVSLHPIYVYFDIDERTYRSIQNFQEKAGINPSGEAQSPVKMGLADEKGFPHEGKIDFTDNRVDPDSGSVWLRGVFDNPTRRLAPGLFVRVQLPIGTPHEAVQIPEKALTTDQGQKHVWVVDDDNHATYRLVQLGALHGTMREVIKGVDRDERVIVEGLQRVRNAPGKDYAEVKAKSEKPEKPGPTKP
jgi:RND family efflux transporter MFP subunit